MLGGISSVAASFSSFCNNEQCENERIEWSTHDALSPDSELIKTKLQVSTIGKNEAVIVGTGSVIAFSTLFEFSNGLVHGLVLCGLNLRKT